MRFPNKKNTATVAAASTAGAAMIVASLAVASFPYSAGVEDAFLTTEGVYMSDSSTSSFSTTVENEAGPVIYQVDGEHSNAVFSVEHMGVSRFYGRFNSISGSFALDSEDLTSATLQVEIKTDSIDTNSDGRDRHLKGPDFFDAHQFPVMSFSSTNVEPKDDSTLTVTGDFSLHGVTKVITVEVDITGQAERRGKVIAGIGSTFTIKRSDFGMHKYVENGALGDEVTIMIGLEGAQS